MSDQTNRGKAGSDVKFGAFFKGLWRVTRGSTVLMWAGLKKIDTNSEELHFGLPLVGVFLFVVTFANFAYLRGVHWVYPGLIPDFLLRLLMRIPPIYHFAALMLFTTYSVGIGMGLREYRRKKEWQRKLDKIGLANAEGEKPQVIAEIELDTNKSKLLLSPMAVGIDRFEAKKGDLEMAFERIIEGISTSENRKVIELRMCKRELRKMISFYEILEQIKKPYHFLIGDSSSGVQVASLVDLPHLLIAGSTGGGKSVFFRVVFLCLLKFSKRIQVYLIDLKRGVEVRELSILPNVRVAKDESEAVKLLTLIRDEMQRRFAYMEKNGIKKIDPEKHGRDLIVVGIDEASVLFSKTSISPAKSALVAKARELTDELAKLSRAAGIHLVIATQKAVKESIDTKVLENLGGRMVFKMATHAGSNTAVGNAKAFNLPDIKGRAIWAGGNQFIEVQAPFLSETEFEDECQELFIKQNETGVGNSQPMLEFKEAKSDEAASFVKAELVAPITPA